MRVRLTVLSAMLLTTAACATVETREVTQSPSTMGIGNVQNRDPLLGTDCRVPCTISPGPGCC